MSSLIERRQFLVGAGALAVAGGAWAAEPRRVFTDFSQRSLGDFVPMRAGAWRGADDADVVPERVDASIDHGQTVTRRYLAEGLAPIMLVVSYHGPQSPDLKVHRPETCYAVAGFEGGRPASMEAHVTPQVSVPAVGFTARREDRVETVLYWTRVGDRFPQTLAGQRIDFFTEALRGYRADGLLVRMSTIGDDPAHALSALQTFAGAFVLSASAQGRALLLGPKAKALPSV